MCSVGANARPGEVDEDELYAALDPLGRSQSGVEKVLARRHLEDGVLVLYDVTSSYPRPRRSSPVAEAKVSTAARHKAARKRPKTARPTAHGVVATRSHGRGVRTEASLCVHWQTVLI